MNTVASITAKKKEMQIWPQDTKGIANGGEKGLLLGNATTAWWERLLREKRQSYENNLKNTDTRDELGEMNL